MTKFIGGLLLIIGTSIGAGILALPVTTSQSGFVYSSLLLFFCWIVMTTAALMILEVNMWLPENSNMISMARHTLGWAGEIVAWITYLLLLYTLLSAYIAGGSDVLSSLLGLIGLKTPPSLTTILFTVILGSVVFCGINTTDYVNRFLMLIKLTTFVVLSAFVASHIQLANLEVGNAHYLPSAIMVMITSFGFATIVPSLRTYFHSDMKKLRRMIIIGSFIPLICYIAWDLAILGVLPQDGDNSLLHILNSGHVTSELMLALQHVINNNNITQLSRLFTSICVLTSFLGVALCLFDFLADGCKIPRHLSGRLLVAALTFLPPLCVVLFYPNAFIMALNYAGMCCIVLLVILPVLMVWKGTARHQYHTQLSILSHKAILVTIFAVGLALLLLGAYQIWGG